MLESIAVQVVKDVNDSLSNRSLPTMAEESQQALRGQIKDLANRTNTVRKLMGMLLFSGFHFMELFSATNKFTAGRVLLSFCVFLNFEAMVELGIKFKKLFSFVIVLQS